jgi:hypothetical protein
VLLWQRECAVVARRPPPPRRRRPANSVKLSVRQFSSKIPRPLRRRSQPPKLIAITGWRHVYVTTRGCRSSAGLSTVRIYYVVVRRRVADLLVVFWQNFSWARDFRLFCGNSPLFLVLFVTICWWFQVWSRLVSLAAFVLYSAPRASVKRQDISKKNSC